jgi:hypothetical protein
MGLFKKYKIEKISENIYRVKRRKHLWKWDTVHDFINRKQAECAIIRLERNKSPFMHYCCVKSKNREHTVYMLKKMGYIQSLTFDIRQKYIYTSMNGCFYSTNNKHVEKISIGNYYDSLYGIYCGDNDDLFLAIAAMNERNDYMQWFYSEVCDCNGNQLPNHIFLCDQDTLERFGWVNNSPNTYKSGVHRKMGINFVIMHFLNKV